VAQAIGCPNAETVLSPFGGNFVQTALNQSALDIQSGAHEVIVLTGAECGNTQAKAAKAEHNLDWAELPGTPDRLIGVEKDMRHDAERAIRLGRPIQIYPIMETALRYETGLGVERALAAYLQTLGWLQQCCRGQPQCMAARS
jgi:acetyl-CoA C-acetyltransferase